jgi:hypothetical protein
VAGVAERHIVRRVLNQQIGLRRRVRLMAGHAVDVRFDLGYVGWVHEILHGMPKDWMSQTVLYGKNDYFVLHVIVFGQLHASVENGQDMFGFELLRFGIRPMTL